MTSASTTSCGISTSRSVNAAAAERLTGVSASTTRMLPAQETRSDVSTPPVRTASSVPSLKVMLWDFASGAIAYARFSIPFSSSESV